MKNIILFGLILLACFFQEARAQTELTGRFITLSEGTNAIPGQNIPGRLDCNFFSCNSGKTVEEIPYFSNALYAYGNTLYLTDGNGWIRLYDLQTMTRTHIIEKADARQVRVWGNYLLASCNKAPFFRVYDRYTFKPVYQSDTFALRNECEGLAVWGNYAFVASNGLNGFGKNKQTDSTIAVFDLQNLHLKTKLFTYANPNQIIETGDKLYVQCLDYGLKGLSIVEINPYELTAKNFFQTGKLSAGGFAPNGDEIYFLETDPNTFAGKGIRSVNVKTWKIKNELEGNFYAIDYLSKYDAFIVSTTDFATEGRVYLNFRQKFEVQEVGTGIAPRAFYYHDLTDEKINTQIVVDGPNGANTAYRGKPVNVIITTNEDNKVSWSYQPYPGLGYITGTERTFKATFTSVGVHILNVRVSKMGCEQFYQIQVTVGIDVSVPDLLFPSAEIKYLPQSQSVEVSYRAGEVKGLQLMDVQGRVLYRSRPEFGSEKSTISVSGNTQGIYLLRLENEQGAVIKKIWVE